MRTPILLLIPVIAFFMGCSSPYVVGTPIEKAKVVQIVPGTTDEAKIVEMFGPPALPDTCLPRGGGARLLSI